MRSDEISFSTTMSHFGAIFFALALVAFVRRLYMIMTKTIYMVCRTKVPRPPVDFFLLISYNLPKDKKKVRSQSTGGRGIGQYPIQSRLTRVVPSRPTQVATIRHHSTRVIL